MNEVTSRWENKEEKYDSQAISASADFKSKDRYDDSLKSKDLEEAARLYAIPRYMRAVDVNRLEEYPYDKIAEAAFLAGAQWQKEQMLKDAKDGYVSAIIIHNDGDEEHYAVTYPNGERPHSITDKVKIIIL